MCSQALAQRCIFNASPLLSASCQPYTVKQLYSPTLRIIFKKIVQPWKIFSQGWKNFFQRLKKVFQGTKKNFQALPHFLKINLACSTWQMRSTFRHLLVARNGVLRCPRPRATLHTPTGNVAHGHGQRGTRPRATNRNGFRIGDPAPCVIASYAQGLLSRTSPSTHTLLQLFKAMKFNGKRKSACEMLNNECKNCHCGWNAPIFAKQEPL